MSKLSSLIQDIIKKSEKTGAQAESKAIKKLPSRALDQTEQEAAEDLFKQDPSMKKMAMEDQADLYGKTSDIPEAIAAELPKTTTSEPNFTLQGNPYRNPNLPVVSQERKLATTPVRDVSELPTEGSITEKLSPTPLETPQTPKSYKAEKIAAGGAGIAAGLGLGMMGDGSSQPPQEPSSQPVPEQRTPASIPKENILTKILAKTAPKGKKGSPASLESVEQSNPEDKALENQQFVEDFLAKENTPEGADRSPASILNPEQNVLDVGTGSNAQEELKAAQKARDQSILFNQLSQIAERGAAAYGGFKPLYGDIYEGNIKRAGQIVDDVKERMDNQKNDPKSPTSQAFKKYMEKFGNLKVKGDFTAAMGEKLLPLEFKKYENMVLMQAKAQENKLARESRDFQAEESRKARTFEGSENRKSREQLAKDAALDRQSANTLKVEQKESQKNTDRLDKMGKLITSEVSSSRGAFGKSANNIRSAEAIQALLDQSKGDFNKLTNNQMYELAKSLDMMLSQSQSTISGTEHLIPKTMLGDSSKIVAYLRNKPTGAQQAAFAKQIADTVAREKQIAQDQVKRTQGKLLGSYMDLKTKEPERFRDILTPHGLEFLMDEDQSKKSESSKESKKTLVKKGYNSTTNQTQLIYSDGSKEIVQGKQ